jgi:hypothetical protein
VLIIEGLATGGHEVAELIEADRNARAPLCAELRGEIMVNTPFS